MKPVEEVGEGDQYDEDIAYGHQFNEGWQRGCECAIAYASVDVGIDDGGYQADASPERQPEAIEGSAVGQKWYEPHEILRAEDFARGDEKE